MILADAIKRTGYAMLETDSFVVSNGVHAWIYHKEARNYTELKFIPTRHAWKEFDYSDNHWESFQRKIINGQELATALQRTGYAIRNIGNRKRLIMNRTNNTWIWNAKTNELVANGYLLPNKQEAFTWYSLGRSHLAFLKLDSVTPGLIAQTKIIEEEIDAVAESVKSFLKMDLTDNGYREKVDELIATLEDYRRKL